MQTSNDKLQSNTPENASKKAWTVPTLEALGNVAQLTKQVCNKELTGTELGTGGPEDFRCFPSF